ncbi:MAG: type II toxin-antitoxin system HicB family antitoxin [Candidatus Pacebacteria bacterium]|nr:type II toxin-antitoxin system HicB family antitoxin [Candidatus Paceibacterota bacterium]
MKDKKLTFKVEYDKEDGWYSACCLQALIFTQGRTFKSLEKNIREAVGLHFSEEIEAKKFRPVISVNYTFPAYV